MEMVFKTGIIINPVSGPILYITVFSKEQAFRATRSPLISFNLQERLGNKVPFLCKRTQWSFVPFF